MNSRMIYLTLGILVVVLSAWVMFNFFNYQGEVEKTSSLNHVILKRRMGDPEALVKIDDYSSFSCPACGYFYTKVLPEVKKRFIDNGQVRFEWHHFPHDQMGLTASAFSNLVLNGEDFWKLATELYETMHQWIDDVSYLQNVVSGYVNDNSRIINFVKNQRRHIEEKIKLQRDVAAGEMDIKLVPTIFINGVKYEGDIGLEEFIKVLEKAYEKAIEKAVEKTPEEQPSESTEK